jgi:hypothetical protein
VRGVVAFRIQQERRISLWLLGYRCVRPSTTPAKNHWLTDARGRATAVNSLDEAQKSHHTEYPRRTVSLRGMIAQVLDRRNESPSENHGY